MYTSPFTMLVIGFFIQSAGDTQYGEVGVAGSHIHTPHVLPTAAPL